MAAQWPHNSPGTGYSQYTPQYGQQASQSYGQQHPHQYAPQMLYQAHPTYPQHPSQQYPQHTPPRQFSQQVAQQTAQQQYLPQQQYDPQQQYFSQQQYEPQQQYPPQQQFSSSMQYSSHPGGQNPNQYLSNSNPAYASQPQHQPTPQGCYNCGSPGHWAQDCPEPKRDPPAGAYSRPPPLKRQKPNPPVVTKYAVPPHVQQQPPAPQVFGPSYAQQSYPQYQGPHGPPTPQSVQSPHQQWPQQPYPQQYQQTPSQQQQYQQPYQQTSYQHQQQPYVPNAPPTPATPYASHLPNQASPQAAHYNAASYFTNGQVQQMSSASPVSAVAQTITHQQQDGAFMGDTASVHDGSRNSSVSMHSMSATPSPEPIVATKEENEDDLSKLDVPDIPHVTQGSFASLVDRPLPANFIVADALEPFDPPPPENNGRCQSKYTVIDKLSTFTSCIKETKYWDDLKGDPIFISRSVSSALIPMKRILAMYRNRREDEEYEPADLEDGEWTRDTTITTRHEGGRDLMDRLDNSLPRPCVTESADVITLRERKLRDDASTVRRSDRSVEVTSAVQAVGGQYHWKRKMIRPIPPPPVREDSPRSPERTPPMRSRTPSMYELNEIYQQEQGIKAGSSNITDEMALGAKASGHGQHHASYDSSDPFEPPPPAHVRKLSSYDGAADCPLPAGSPKGHVNGNGVSRVHNSNGNGKSDSNEHWDTPSRRRSDAVNGRKRESEQALSDEDNTPKRRQADDTKAKLRKRQPKVAAAYSRRW